MSEVMAMARTVDITGGSYVRVKIGLAEAVATIRCGSKTKIYFWIIPFFISQNMKDVPCTE